ncbi:MAG: TadE/TadG family type IV pilus assembly protein [Acidimicrobiia bacterium]
MTTTQVTILMPVLLFWIMLIVQYGLWYHAKQVANAAAAEAVDAAQTPAGTAALGERAAHDFLTSSGNLSAPVVSVERDLDRVVAEVRGDAPRLVPGFSWSVTGRVEAPVERFVPENERE